MDRTGIIHWLAERLHDPRNPSSIRHRLSDLLHTRLLLLGQGWRDQSNADRLRDDPGLRVASDSRRGTAPLEQEQGLASQPSFRERVLRVASRVVCHGRRLIFVVSEAATDWRRLWRHLKRVFWVPG